MSVSQKYFEGVRPIQTYLAESLDPAGLHEQREQLERLLEEVCDATYPPEGSQQKAMLGLISFGVISRLQRNKFFPYFSTSREQSITIRKRDKRGRPRNPKRQRAPHSLVPKSLTNYIENSLHPTNNNSLLPIV